jgi:hypothetical protein
MFVSEQDTGGSLLSYRRCAGDTLELHRGQGVQDGFLFLLDLLMGHESDSAVVKNIHYFQSAVAQLVARFRSGRFMESG